MIRGELSADEQRTAVRDPASSGRSRCRDDKAITAWNGAGPGRAGRSGPSSRARLTTSTRRDAARRVPARPALRPEVACTARSRRRGQGHGLPRGLRRRRRTACSSCTSRPGELALAPGANRLARLAIELFADDERGGFYLAAPTARSSSPARRISRTTRRRAGNSMLAVPCCSAWRGSTGDDELERRAVGVFRLVHGAVTRAPSAFGTH